MTLSRSKALSTRRRSPLPARLLCLTLFGCGFLLGRAGSAGPVSSPPLTAQVSPSLAAVEETSRPWYLLLVNRDNPLPEDFSIPELTHLKNGHAIDARAYPALQSMMDDARAVGYDPLICSSYRTREKQEALFDKKVRSYLDLGYSQDRARELAAGWVSPPGTSEHQAGLSVDIVDRAYQLLDEEQEKRPVQQWLMEHCAEYGFILRYPTGKSDLTGVEYEPWHYRYVGEEAAKEIMSGGLCLEEYLADLSS